MSQKSGTVKGEGFRKEYFMGGASPRSVWNQISTSRGLSEWFAPKVDIFVDRVHVYWDQQGDDREGTIETRKEGSVIKWVWNDDPESFLSMKVVSTELSHVTSLLVDDHDRSLSPVTLEALWEVHIEKLKATLGIP